MPRPLPLLPAAILCVALARPGAAPAQTLAELTETPDSTAVLFLRSVRAIRWSAAAQFMHDSTLAYFHEVTEMMVDTDTTGALRRDLTGTASARELRAMPSEEVFDRAIGRMVDDMPGFMHSLFDHDDEVIGHVREGADSAHVVYRTVEQLSGAVPEVRVIQMARTPEGWRVLWSDELEVLEAALRGVPLARRGPPRAPGAGWAGRGDAGLTSPAPRRVSSPFPRAAAPPP